MCDLDRSVQAILVCTGPSSTNGMPKNSRAPDPDNRGNHIRDVPAIPSTSFPRPGTRWNEIPISFLGPRGILSHSRSPAIPKRSTSFSTPTDLREKREFAVDLSSEHGRIFLLVGHSTSVRDGSMAVESPGTRRPPRTAALQLLAPKGLRAQAQGQRSATLGEAGNHTNRSWPTRNGFDHMPRHRIPKNPGECEVITTKAGAYAVSNKKTGKNKVLIPCRDQEQAQDIARKIDAKDHDGEIWG
jgi:hypothetical protein